MTLGSLMAGVLRPGLDAGERSECVPNRGAPWLVLSRLPAACAGLSRAPAPSCQTGLTSLGQVVQLSRVRVAC